MQRIRREIRADPACRDHGPGDFHLGSVRLRSISRPKAASCLEKGPCQDGVSRAGRPSCPRSLAGPDPHRPPIHQQLLDPSDLETRRVQCKAQGRDACVEQLGQPGPVTLLSVPGLFRSRLLSSKFNLAEGTRETYDIPKLFRPELSETGTAPRNNMRAGESIARGCTVFQQRSICNIVWDGRNATLGTGRR